MVPQHVLVLNASYEPLKIVDWQRAITLWYQGKAEIVETHDREVRAVTFSFKLPSVVRLLYYVKLKRRPIVQFTRANIYARDGFTCQYCDRLFDPSDLNLDHVIPRDKGGKTSWEIVVASCIRCNSKKANKMPHEARMFPRTAPRAPRWRPFHASLQNTEPRNSWRDFIEVTDGTVEISA